MSSNSGNAIQKLLDDSPNDITSNNDISAVLTKGGKLYLSGLINNNINSKFIDVELNVNVIGKVIQALASDNSVYILNSSGSVFLYDYNSCGCNSELVEIYSPNDCNGDNAIKIAVGSDHCIILTKSNRVSGSGLNTDYQLVSQGLSKYVRAVQLVIDGTNFINNINCATNPTGSTQLNGIFNYSNTPVFPNTSQSCAKPICMTGDFYPFCTEYPYKCKGDKIILNKTNFMQNFNCKNKTDALKNLQDNNDNKSIKSIKSKNVEKSSELKSIKS